jgi:predicted phosphoribosyltransferase
MTPPNHLDEMMNRAVQRLRRKPTLVVGFGSGSHQTARRTAAALGVEYGIAVDAPVVDPDSGEVIGVVSGTDDSSFWNTAIIGTLRLETERIQQLGLLARLEAVREFRALAAAGGRPVPPSLDRSVVLCVCGPAEDPALRYRFSLLRSRRPESICLLGTDPTCADLEAAGLVEEVLLLPRAA